MGSEMPEDLAINKKKNEIMPTTWLDLGTVWSQTEKQTYHLYVESKNSTHGLIYKTERESQV